ncbi:MAG: histidine triad nucleotide-binding protein [Candidatus Chisholmbacteria bacterium]|nr:histidine triad nucleotide-binding protein [Candidatus Chisholmbacteria bacterium]
MVDECVFCKIVNKQLPSRLVDEDEEFMAFHDINPKAPIHVLVVPRRHIESDNSLKTQDEILAGRMILKAAAVAKKLGIDEAYQLKVSVGEKAGQSVWHLHVHVLGGWDTPQVE